MMPVTNDDIKWLTYGALRLRDETHGACKWDGAGTFKVFSEELIGTHFAIALERVLGHATDPEAKTPGAIKRPFIPEPATPVSPRIVYDPRQVCHDCGKRFGIEHAQADHGFRSIEAVRAIRPTPAPKGLRAAIAATPRTWPKTETSNKESQHG